MSFWYEIFFPRHFQQNNSFTVIFWGKKIRNYFLIVHIVSYCAHRHNAGDASSTPGLLIFSFLVVSDSVTPWTVFIENERL